MPKSPNLPPSAQPNQPDAIVPGTGAWHIGWESRTHTPRIISPFEFEPGGFAFFLSYNKVSYFRVIAK